VVSVIERLKAKAALRTKDVTIDGDVFRVQEVGAVSFAEYGKLARKDQLSATALLLAECVLDEEGKLALNREDALAIAHSARVTMPLIQAIMDVSGFGADEKEPDAS